MDEKRSAFFTIILLSAILLLFTAADLIQKDRIFSEAEEAYACHFLWKNG